MIAALESRVGRLWVLIVAVLAAALLAVGAPAPARAADVTGSIAGTITSSGNPFTQPVTVSLYRLDGSNWDYVANAETLGDYSFEALALGTYTLSVTPASGGELAAVWWGDAPTKESAKKIVIGTAVPVIANVKLPLAGILAGKVATSTGDGIVGALVSISLATSAGPVKVADLETDPFGGYRLEGLNAGAYTLDFTATVGSSTPTATRTATVTAGETKAVDVAFAVPVQVQVTVRDSDGTLVPGAEVTLTKSGETEPTAKATASAAATFSFTQVDAGTYTIGASLNASSAQQTFSFADGSDAAITVTIPRRGALTGTIRNAGGAVVPGASVIVWRANGSKVVSTTAAADGTFRVIGLADGSYTVSGGLDASMPLAYLGSARTLRAAQFAVVTSGASIAVGSISFPTGASTSGFVGTTDGSAVSGAIVTLYRSTGGVAGRATTDGSGSYTVAGVAPGTYLVGVAAPSGSEFASAEVGAATVTVIGSTAVTVPDIVLAAGGTASGSVATVALAPVADATVGVYQRTSAGGLTHVADVTTSSAGAFTASGLRAGTYTFAVTPSGSSTTTWFGGASSGATASTATIAVGPATPVDRILLPFAPGSVGGTINATGAGAGDRAAAKVVLQSTTDADATMTASPTATGAFSFTSVPDGTYRIVVRGLAGYAETWSGAAAREKDAAIITVRGGAAVTANITAIRAEASVSGWLDADEPLPADATVTALRVFADGAIASSGVAANVDNWSYAIEGLVDGADYVLRIDAGHPQPEYWGGATPADAETFTATTAGTDLDDIWLLSRGSLHGTAHDGGGSTSVDGTRVTLFSGSTAVDDTTIEGGAYSFDGVLPGPYSVRFGDPEDATALFASVFTGGSADPATAPTFTIAAQGDTDAGSAALPRAHSITGTASATVDGSVADQVVALAGTTVTLAAGGVVIAHATADAVGGFEFAVAPGLYTVCVSAPAAGAYSRLGLAAGCWTGAAGTADAVGTPITVAGTDVGDIRILLAKPPALQALGAPTLALTGTAAVGYAMAITSTEWANSPTVTYQWYADGAPIAGATTTSLVPAAALAGRALSVRVTGTKAGFLPVATSTASSARVMAWGAVAVAGTVAVGYKVSASVGSWTSGTAFTYQWYANGTAIKGATKSTFTVTKTQAGRSLSVRVTGAKSGYTSITRVSAGTLKAMTAGAPKVSDTTPARKQKISVKAGTWTSGTRIAYQWYLNGVAIKGATKSSITVSSGWKGKKLSVRVTGSKSGYTTVSITKGTSGVH